MKAKLPIRQTMIVALFGIAALSFQANAQVGCFASYTFTINANTVTFTSTSTGPVSHYRYWNFGDGTSAGATGTSVAKTYTANGTYIACLTIQDSIEGCSDTYCDTILISTLRVEEINAVSYMQNYPNPFYKTTLIRYTLDKNSAVRVAIYDRAGNKVAELEHSEKSAGQHQIEWNAGNLPAGAYHIELQAGTNSTTRKLLLIK